jgi:site-specific DNA-methyltransferase (adenine-specific)
VICLVSDIVFSRKSDEYITPKKLYDELNNQFNFQLDPATTQDNPLKTTIYFTQSDDGLNLQWPAVNTFINPPYSKVGKWVAKAHDQFVINGKKNPKLAIVMLVASRTDTKWFHDIILQAQEKGYCRIKFLKGRVKFQNTQNSSPFPSMLVILAQSH